MADNWQNRIIGLEWKPANQLLANPANPRRHPIAQREALRGSLSTIGWYDTIIENKTTGELIDGHARVEEALTKDENMLLPVLVVEMSASEQDLTLAGHDWITSLATYDRDQLDSLLQSVNTDNEALQAMLAGMAEANDLYFGDAPVIAEDMGAQIDRADELQAKWQVARGDVWVIPSLTGDGEHRLLCGDCFDVADCDSVLCGTTPQMLYVDPPYDFDKASEIADMTLYVAQDAHIFVLNHDSALVDYLRVSNHRFHGFFIFDHIFSQPRANMPYQQHIMMVHEIAGKPQNYAITNDGFSTLIRIKYRGTLKEGALHPHQKAVQDVITFIEHYTKPNDIVFDPFTGSGTTIVACEQSARRAFAMEIEPSYCAAILERLSHLGLAPERVGHD